MDISGATQDEPESREMVQHLHKDRRPGSKLCSKRSKHSKHCCPGVDELGKQSRE